MADLKRITLFKIKPERGFGDFLKGSIDSYDHNEDVEHGFEVYLKYANHGSGEKTEEQIPWLKFLNAGFDETKYKFNAHNRYPRALMALRVSVDGTEDAYFVVTFGQHGDTYLDKSHIVYDFGIKVGMNICDLDGLRRVQTSIHESISKQTERQASVGASLSVFGIDTEAEFLRTISGHVKKEYSDFLETFRGKDSIAIKLPRNTELSWQYLVEICRKLEERYWSTDYRDTEFRAYDQLRHETDPTVTDELDKLLCEKIATKNFSKLHLAPPEFVESEEVSYAYQEKTGADIPPLFDDLRIEDIVSVPRRRLKNVTAGTLKSWKINGYDAEQDITRLLWNAYQCIVAEIEFGEKTFVLSNGQWREISQELKEKVVNFFDNLVPPDNAAYLPEGINIYDAARDQNREDVYTNNVARTQPQTFLLDKAKIEIAGERRYEMCDLLHADRHFVHIKKYLSGAASITHLFSQARFYSHAFSKEEATRQSMRDWIETNDADENNGKDRNAFLEIIPVKKSELRESDYTVVFCILHTEPEFSVADLPFMAQHELMLCHRFLTEDRNFKVDLIFRRVELGAAA